MSAVLAMSGCIAGQVSTSVTRCAASSSQVPVSCMIRTQSTRLACFRWHKRPDTVGEVGWVGGGRVCCGGSPRRRPAMSLKPSPIQPVPEGTARVARAAFRKGNPLLKLRDELGAIFADADFADLFPRLGQPGLPPWRLALVTLLQF